MKQRKLSRWIVSILVVCLGVTMALAACTPNENNPDDATYYLSVDGATYSSASDVPSGVKFVKSDDVYTLTVELEQGKVLTVNKVGSTDKIGYNGIFSTAGKLTEGSNNTILVGESGTYALTLDPSDEKPLTYLFTAKPPVGGNETAVKGVTLNKNELVLGLDGSEQLIATVSPATALNKSVLWTSSNSSVAAVDQEGNVSAVSAGTAVITVTTVENSFTDTCQVTVRQGVTSISLSSSALTVYTGEGASTRELTVTINPDNASNKDYIVSVEQADEYISYVKAGTSITVTGLAVGSATLTVTSTDNSEATASCVITVANISDAVPALSKDHSTVDIDGDDVVNILLDNGDITSFTVTSNSTAVATVAKSASDNSFTVKGKGFGTTTVTVSVVYGDSKTETLTLTVRVAASQFFLTGNFDGTNWGTPSTVDGYLTTYDVELEEVEDGIYEITRNFAAQDKLYILPSTGDYWTYALKKGYYSAQSNGSSYFETPDNDNVLVKYAGNYTVRLNLTGTKASWTVIVNSVVISKATLSTTASSIKGEERASLTLSIEPSVVTVDAGSIDWSIKETEYSEWVNLSVGGTAMSATLSLSDKFTGESVNITIVVTITIDGNEVARAEQQIALLGNTVTPVTDIQFDDTGDAYLDVSGLTLGNWTLPVTAHVNSDASVQTITYSIKESSLYANNDGTHRACSIDSNGTVTAWMFGTYTVVATSDGTNSDGSTIYVEKTIHVYAQTFYLNIAWNTDHTTNPSTTTTDYAVYTWKDVKFSAENQAVVILYAGLGDSEDWFSVIRSGSYLNTAGSTSGTVTGTSGGNGSFTVKTIGMYDVTLDISGSTPSVTFVRTGDLTPEDNLSITVNIHDSNNYDTPLVTETVSFTSADETRTLTTTLQYSSAQSWPNIEFTTVIDGTTTYYNGSKSGVTFSGSKYSSSSSSGTWTNSNSGCKLWIASVSTSDKFTFVFTFDEYGGITAISIN